MSRPLTFKHFLFSLFLLFSISYTSNANHILGGDITYTCSNSNTYNLQLRLYRDCLGIPLGNTANINIFSPTCGTQSVTLTLLPGYPQDATELCTTSTSACSGVGSYGVHEYVYKSSISFVGCWASASDIRISWSSCCRPHTITNINNPSTSFFYLYNEIDNSLNCTY